MPAFIEPAKAKNVAALDLKEMDLHAMIDLGRLRILRVWGGWIYLCFEPSKAVTAVFVPQTSSEQSESQ